MTIRIRSTFSSIIRPNTNTLYTNTRIHRWCALDEKAVLFWCLFRVHHMTYGDILQTGKQFPWTFLINFKFLHFPRFSWHVATLKTTIVARPKTAIQKDLAGHYDRAIPTVDKQQQQYSSKVATDTVYSCPKPSVSSIANVNFSTSCS